MFVTFVQMVALDYHTMHNMHASLFAVVFCSNLEDAKIASKQRRDSIYQHVSMSRYKARLTST